MSRAYSEWERRLTIFREGSAVSKKKVKERIVSEFRAAITSCCVIKILLQPRNCRRLFAARCYAQARTLPPCGVCLSVRPSVTFVFFVKMSNHVLKLYPPSGSHIILVFFTPNLMIIFWQEPPPPPMGASNAGDMEKSRFTSISLCLRNDTKYIVTMERQ